MVGPAEPYKSCIIEELILQQNSDKCDRMVIFVGLLRQTQRICLDRGVVHLAMARRPGDRWYTGLLTQAGFGQCECDRPGIYFLSAYSSIITPSSFTLVPVVMTDGFSSLTVTLSPDPVPWNWERGWTQYPEIKIISLLHRCADIYTDFVLE